MGSHFGVKQGKADPKATRDLVIEVVRRTRKGKLKTKGLLLLHAGGEKIFALSPDDLTGPGQGLKSSVSCCERARHQGTGCCKGLAWDPRYHGPKSTTAILNAQHLCNPPL